MSLVCVKSRCVSQLFFAFVTARHQQFNKVIGAESLVIVGIIIVRRYARRKKSRQSRKLFCVLKLIKRLR